ncbi:MAG: BatD family protein, partial [Thermodesulfobacteriota bacterium]
MINSRGVQAVFASFTLLFLLLATTLSAWGATSAEATASLSQAEFSVDDSSHLTLTVHDMSNPQVELPAVDGLSFVPRGQSFHTQWINGRSSKSVALVYEIRSGQPGTYTIPAMVIRDKKQEAKTSPLQLTVTAARSANSSGQQLPPSAPRTTRLGSGEADQIAFIRLGNLEKEYYPGEVVPFTIKAYFREGIRASLNSLPQLVSEGFIMEQVNNQPHQQREIVANLAYTVLSWQTSLSPIKQGQQSLTVELDATLLLPQQRRRHPSSFGGSMFDDSFFDDFFSRYQKKPVHITSPEIELAIISLPKEGRPKDFSGAVGNFELEVSATPTELELGEPITLSMTVSGRGGFDNMESPKLTDSNGWKTYPASEKLTTGPDGQAVKSFEQAVVPKKGDITAIPPMRLSYFDPQDKKYKTLTSEAIPLAIKGKAEPSPPPPTQPAEVKAEQPVLAAVEQDSETPFPTLSPLRAEEGTPVQSIEPLYKKIWFQVALLTCLALLALVAFVRLRRNHRSRHPDRVRRKLMKEQLQKSLRRIEEARHSSDERQVLTCCREALQQQFGLLWDRPPSAITIGDLSNTAGDNSPLISIMNTIDDGLYGDHTPDKEEMAAMESTLAEELA